MSTSRSQMGRNYLWNSAASLAGSISLVLMLAVVTRTVSLEAGGVYALAIANGQLFQTLGMYDVRTYHVTDVRPRFSFGTYLAVRIITVGLMLAGIVIRSMVSGGPPSHVVLLVLIASLRFFDAFEDVFYSEFQRQERLDLGGRASFLRTLATTVVFCGVLVGTGDLMVSTVATLVVSLVVMVVVYLPPARALFPLRPSWEPGPIVRVLVECLPLCIALFLAQYLVTAPRWAIEASLGEEAQGYFAIIYMPAVAINLLSLLVFRPLLTPLAERWVGGDRRGFLAIVRGGLGVTALASLAVAVIAYVLGVPVLNLVYGSDVQPYRGELMVLVGGGALNAASVVLSYALSTMRRQHLVFVGYAVAAVTVASLSRLLVPAHGLMGASLAYTAAMAALVACFAAGALLSRGTAPEPEPSPKEDPR